MPLGSLLMAAAELVMFHVKGAQVWTPYWPIRYLDKQRHHSWRSLTESETPTVRLQLCHIQGSLTRGMENSQYPRPQSKEDRARNHKGGETPLQNKTGSDLKDTGGLTGLQVCNCGFTKLWCQKINYQCKIFPSCRSEPADSSQLILGAPHCDARIDRRFVPVSHAQSPPSNTDNTELPGAATGLMGWLKHADWPLTSSVLAVMSSIQDVRDAEFASPMFVLLRSRWVADVHLNDSVKFQHEQMFDIQDFTLTLSQMVFQSAAVGWDNRVLKDKVQKEHIKPSFQLFLIWIWSHCWSAEECDWVNMLLKLELSRI